MRVRTVVFVLAASAAASLPAAAQDLRLPTTSRAERQLNENNRALAIQQQDRRFEQQSQFEVHQLRTQIQRDQSFPTPGSTRICAIGQLGC